MVEPVQNMRFRRDFYGTNAKAGLSWRAMIFAEHDYLAYPVVDGNGRIVGIVSLENLKDTLADTSFQQWLIATDVMMPVTEKTTAATPLKEALDLMAQLHLDQLPVVAENDSLVGLLEQRAVRKAIGQEVIRRQQAVSPGAQTGPASA